MFFISLNTILLKEFIWLLLKNYLITMVILNDVHSDFHLKMNWIYHTLLCTESVFHNEWETIISIFTCFDLIILAFSLIYFTRHHETLIKRYALFCELQMLGVIKCAICQCTTLECQIWIIFVLRIPDFLRLIRFNLNDKAINFLLFIKDN